MFECAGNDFKQWNCFSQDFTISSDTAAITECTANWLVGFSSNITANWTISWSLHVKRPA